jgi:enterochelin esterase family protein
MSPRLASLAASARSDSAGTAASFWSEIRERGAPLVEEIPGDSANVLVTFLYRGDKATRNVVLFQGPRVTQNVADNPFALLVGTNVWYRSYVIRRDARFTYLVGANVDLSPQDPANPGELFLPAPGVQHRLAESQTRSSARRSAPQAASATPFHEHSAVRASGRSRSRVARRPGVPSGKVERFKLTEHALEE